MARGRVGNFARRLPCRMEVPMRLFALSLLVAVGLLVCAPVDPVAFGPQAAPGVGSGQLSYGPYMEPDGGPVRLA